MNELLQLLLPILLIAAGTFATSAFVFMKAKVSVGWKALAIPAAFVGAVVVPLTIADSIGRALPASQLPDHVRVFAHQTIIQDGKKKRIEIWTAEPRQPTRLYSVPYNKQLEKQLEKAAQGRAQGLQSELRRRKPGDKQQKPGQDEGDFGLDFKRPQDIMQPKEGDSTEPPDIDELLKPDKPGLTA